ncbi:MAG: hypothetical protein PHS14_00235 [Elusimicrobia bacterium]|nr:hypothetical protein [Elusimicrobiota bacterium]
MAGKELKTKGGATLFLSHAAFEDGLALTKAVNKVMLDLKLFGAEGSETTLRLFGDAEVYACYLRCAEKATYNGRKLEAALYDDPKAGESASRDLLEVFDAIVHYNTSRFFPVASSASSTPSPAA